MRTGTGQRMGSVLALSLAAGFLAGPTFPARAADGRDIVQNGNGHGAPACMACHGPEGQGNPEVGYPRLSGMSETYAVHQLESFAGGLRANEIMGPIAKALGDEDRRAVAAFYLGQSSAKAEGGEVPDPKLVATGEVIAARGDWSRGLPACGSCHGSAGQGIGIAFPALAAQPVAYLTGQLTAWKAKTRKNDALGLMAGITRKLTDADIAAVSAYYASLPPPPTKSGRAP